MKITQLIVYHARRMYHPFLLADNRHYVFYVLRRVFLPYPLAKHFVTPIYLFCIWILNWRLSKLSSHSTSYKSNDCSGNTVTVLWILGFIACALLVLVPTPLIEPRYFLIPTILLRLQLRNPDNLLGQKALSVEYAWYILINVSTMALFLMKKFRWEGWEGWMRFMW